MFVPERRRLAEAVRDAVPPPSPLAKPLVGAVRGLVERARHAVPPGAAGVGAPEPVLVAPGSLGSWSELGEGVGDDDGAGHDGFGAGSGAGGGGA